MIVAGRYRVERIIGKGGSAAVYLACDTWLDDRSVALKVLTTVDRPYAQLLAREFALLFPIRHPHIPLVHALCRLPERHALAGVPPAAPFLVEELCPGTPAPEWARGRDAGQIAMVGAQLAAALAALHARGVSHGDVKPENVLVSGDDEPVAMLIDFNLAARGPSATVSGTLRYMAPEALNGARTLASDLYSLAATLVELLTGAPPSGDHGNQLDAPLLGEAVAAMTHPDEERRADAPTAFEMLCAKVPEPGRDRVLALRDLSQPSTGFVGRDAVLRALDEVLTASTGGTHVVRLRGAPGSGKTAALQQAVIHAAMAGRAIPGAIRPARHGELVEVERAITELHGECDLRGEQVIRDHDSERVAPTDPCTEQWQQFALLGERLCAVTAKMPVALVFDDVPEDSPLDRFAGFLERMGNMGPRVAWVQSSVNAHDDAVPLPPLEADHLAQAIRIARPLRPRDNEAAERLHVASGGVPQVAITLLDSFPGDALLRAARDNTLQVDDLDALNSRRLSDLGPGTRDLVATVALLTPPVPLSLLRRMTTVHETHIEEAVRAGLLMRQGWRAGPSVRLSGQALAESSRALAKEPAMRAVAEVLSDDNDPERAAELGRLWQRLGEPARAHEPLLAGARHAAAGLRLADALAHYDAVLALEEEVTTRDIARIESARLLVALGRSPDAVLRLEAARAHPEARLVLAEALIGLGRYREAADRLRTTEDDAAAAPLAARALLHAGDHAAARQVAEAGLPRPGARRAELQGVLGLCAYYRGDLDTALDLFGKAIARAAGDPPLLDTLRANLALVLHKRGDLDGAERAYTESLASARAARDLPRQLRRLTNLAALRQEQGAIEAALAGYQEAHDLARLVDGSREMVHVALNWGNLLLFLGDSDAARDHVAPALATAESLGMTIERAYLTLVDAEIALAHDDAAAATTAALSAETLFNGCEDHAGLAETEALRAEIALHRHEATEARERARTAAERARAAGRERIEAQALLWLALADLEDPSASPDAALAAAMRAADIALQRGDPDLGWLANAAASRLHARIGRAQDTQLHMQKARSLAGAARSRLSARYERGYAELWYRRDLWNAVRRSGETRTAEPHRDLDRLLAINRELARDHDPERLLERIIDAAIALSGAERGFIVLKEEEDALRIRAARNVDQTSLDDDALNISRSIATEAMDSGMPVTSINALDDDRFAEFLSVHQMKLRSVLCLPLRAPHHVMGALYLDNRYRVSAFSEADVAILSAFGDQAAIALANARYISELDARSQELESSRTEIEELNQRLERELAAQSTALALARTRAGESDDETGSHGMVGRTTEMREVFRVIDRVADKNVPVTILGESGTGKELVARAVHARSQRAAGPFVSINCGAIPAELLESELFGHERGAFTGAVRTKPGLFEVAQAGTIFLDEIGDMPLSMQVKLLRVLQQKEFRRVGGTDSLETDVRVVSASNQDLETMVRQGTFREDLWYRLNVVEVHLPPLRERREDVPLLIEHLLRAHGGGRLSKAALAALLDYDWPGNVRELDNELQRAVALADGEIDVEALTPKVREHVRGVGTGPECAGQTLREAVERFERRAIQAALIAHRGKVAAAARTIGLTRAGLYKKINKYGIINADK